MSGQQPQRVDGHRISSDFWLCSEEMAFGSVSTMKFVGLVRILKLFKAAVGQELSPPIGRRVMAPRGARLSRVS